jgi:hypothetical protein
MISLASHVHPCRQLGERASPFKAFIYDSFDLYYTMFERSLVHLTSALRLASREV